MPRTTIIITNQILQGLKGTGGTYHTKQKCLNPFNLKGSPTLCHSVKPLDDCPMHTKTLHCTTLGNTMHIPGSCGVHSLCSYIWQSSGKGEGSFPQIFPH